MMQFKHIPLKKMEERLIQLETRIRDIHLSSDNYIPDSQAKYMELYDIAREIYDITEGENAVVFDKLGRAHVMYIFRAKDGLESADFWGDDLSKTTEFNSSWKDVLPCFIRNGRTEPMFAVAKYQCTRVNGATNIPVSLYGVSPAHSGGGFTVSYNGATAAFDGVNDGSFPSHMPLFLQDKASDIHMITWDEWAYILLQCKKNSFEPYGNSNYGLSTQGYGIKAQYQYSNYRFVQTLNGTGPRKWRHNGKMTGLADICGNCNEIISGVSINDGYFELIDFRSTSGNLTSSELGGGSNLWKRIRAMSSEYTWQSLTDDQKEKYGAFIDPSTVGTEDTDGETIKAYCIDFENEVANYSQPHFISDSITHYSDTYYSSTSAKNVEVKEGLRLDPKLQMIAAIPFVSEGLSGKQFLKTASGQRFEWLAGGYWSSGSSARPGCVIANSLLSFSSSIIGCRPASRIKELIC